MAEETKNIDKLIKEKLLGHKVPAPAGAWERLEADLVPARRRAMAIYWKLAAAVVLLLLAFGGGYFLSQYHINKTSVALSQQAADEIKQTVEKDAVSGVDNSAFAVVPGHVVDNEELNRAEPDKNNIVPAEKSSAKSEPSQEKITEKNRTVATQKAPANVRNTNAVALSEDQSDLKQKTAEEEVLAKTIESRKPENDEVVQTDETVAQAPVLQDETDKDLEEMTPEMLHRLLVRDDGFDDATLAEVQKPSVRGWSVGGQVSPTYSYRSLGGGSFQTPDEEVDQSYFNDIESGLSTVGGGISLAYNFSERLSIGSGLYLSRIGQENDDVIAYDSPGSGYMYRLGTSSGTVSINPAKFEQVMIRQLDDSKDSVPGDYLVNGTFVQNLDYIDVPLVLNYKVLNKRFSVNLSGGLSPGLLVNNRSYFDVDGQKIQTGITENIKPMIFNSVIGIGMAYDISKKVSVNLSPTFKYSLSPVNKGSALKYHPYSISLFTGIAYKL